VINLVQTPEQPCHWFSLLVIAHAPLMIRQVFTIDVLPECRIETFGLLDFEAGPCDALQGTHFTCNNSKPHYQ